MSYLPQKSCPGEFSAGEHVCLLYGSEKRRITVLKQCIKSALQTKEKVLYIGSDNPLVSRALFSPGDTQIESCLKSGQLEVCDPVRGNFKPGELPSFVKAATEKALAVGWHRLLFTLDIRAILQAGFDPLEITASEAKLNQVCRSSGCRSVCQYNYRTLSPELILDALATHPIIAVGEMMVENPFFFVPPPFLGQDSPEIVLDRVVKQVFEKGRCCELI